MRYAVFSVFILGLVAGALLAIHGDTLVGLVRSAAGFVGIPVSERMPYPSPDLHEVTPRYPLVRCPNGTVVYVEGYQRKGTDGYYAYLLFYDSYEAERPFAMVEFSGPGEYVMLYLDQNKDGLVDHKAKEPDERFGDGPCDVLPTDAPKVRERRNA